jgi:hypothetical protein
MLRLRGNLRLGLSLGLLLTLMTGTTRAEFISMTMTDSSGSTILDFVATSTATTYNVDSFGLFVINSILSSQGSEYQFFSLGGSSNFPGDSAQGNLVLTGEVHSVVGGGNDSFLQVTESESGFTYPTGSLGSLMSASTGNFTNQAAGGGHTAASLFNTTSTPIYSVFSTTTAVNPEGTTGFAIVSPATTLYTLTNAITFDLGVAGANDVIDSFSVTATLTATAVPGPPSFVLLMTGAPLVILVVTRRRRNASIGR